jgi:hypothetical protein
MCSTGNETPANDHADYFKLSDTHIYSLCANTAFREHGGRLQAAFRRASLGSRELQ